MENDAGGGTGWKSSTGLIVGLLIVGAALWAYRLTAKEEKAFNIPCAYWDTASESIYLAKSALRDLPPYKHPKTGKRTLWEPYTCTRSSCQKKMEKAGQTAFPKTMDLPENVKPPEVGEAPSAEYQAIFDASDDQPVRCPYCRRSTYTERYVAPKTKAAIEKMRKSSSG